jgi:excisionase family DNA binding protein
MPRSGGLTLELKGKTTPERLIAEIRRQAPHLLDETPPPEPRAQQVKTNPRPGPAKPRPQQAKGFPEEAEPLLTPAEVATMFRVDPKTVTRWAKAGKLTSIRTPGGHRRYRESEVLGLLYGTDTGAAES